VRILDTATGKNVARLFHGGIVSAASFSPDDRASYLRVITVASGVRVWQVARSTNSLVQIAKNSAPRCLTQKERTLYFLPEAPPIWCITGPGQESEKDPAKWQPKSPYQSAAWRDWLVAKQRGEESPLPKEE
jgi:hypothetical protein